MAFPIRKGVARSLRCVVAAILCVVALAVPARAFADTPAIAYDGNARQLTVSGATMSSGEPDLFPAFKDLMPGDEREQQIEIRATGVKSQVRVFVRRCRSRDDTPAVAHHINGSGQRCVRRLAPGRNAGQRVRPPYAGRNVYERWQHSAQFATKCPDVGRQ